MRKYSELLRRATESYEYWSHLAKRQFTSDLAERMEALGMSRSALAGRIGVSPAYVTKIMRGNANLTLDTMTKLAIAVGGKVQARIIDPEPAVHRAHSLAEIGVLGYTQAPVTTTQRTVHLRLVSSRPETLEGPKIAATQANQIAEQREGIAA